MNVLCYSGSRHASFGGYDGTGVHLSSDGRLTLCGRVVLDVPIVPRVIAPLSCTVCASVTNKQHALAHIARIERSYCSGIFRSR